MNTTFTGPRGDLVAITTLSRAAAAMRRDHPDPERDRFYFAVAAMLANVAAGLVPNSQTPPEASDASQALAVARAYLGEACDA